MGFLRKLPARLDFRAVMLVGAITTGIVLCFLGYPGLLKALAIGLLVSYLVVPRKRSRGQG